MSRRLRLPSWAAVASVACASPSPGPLAPGAEPATVVEATPPAPVHPNPAGVDADGDGLLDRDDACPDLPEDIDAFEDEDGCPDPDNDGDGILDPDDQCPNEPETYDGRMDEDGCPG